MSSSLRLLPLALALAGCSDEVPIEVPVGPLTFTVDVSSINVPAALRESGSVARLACGPTAACPAAAPFTLRCVSGACDPDPVAIELGVMDPIDLGAWSTAFNAVGSNVSQITVARAQWQAAAMGLRNPVGPVEIFWGTESATGPTADGARRLGTVPAITFDAQGNAAGEVALDPMGNATLSTHLLRTSRRFRVFARAAVDLAPGAPLPAGRASIQLRLSVRAETRLLP